MYAMTLKMTSKHDRSFESYEGKLFNFLNSLSVFDKLISESFACAESEVKPDTYFKCFP